IVDATFLSANMLKILEGAWVPLLFGISMVLLIITWRRGTDLLAHKTRRTEVPLDVLLRIELALDASARLVGNFALAQQLVDECTLGGNQVGSEFRDSGSSFEPI